MTNEHANHSARPGVQPPTKEEFAYASSRGLSSISGEQLAEIRAQTSVAKRATAPAALKTTLGSPAPVETLAERKLKKKVDRLKNEIAILKIRIMTGK